MRVGCGTGSSLVSCLGAAKSCPSCNALSSPVICNGSTLNAWTTRSSIWHATASDVTGPYTLSDMVSQPWAHNAMLSGACDSIPCGQCLGRDQPRVPFTCRAFLQ